MKKIKLVSRKIARWVLTVVLAVATAAAGSGLASVCTAIVFEGPAAEARRAESGALVGEPLYVFDAQIDRRRVRRSDLL